MASEVDICNLALSHLGQDANITAIDPLDGSFEADKAATFYPIARDELLEKHAWRFATVRKALTQLSLTPAGKWLYAYSVPNGMVRGLALYLQGETDENNGQEFTVETNPDDEQTQIIYTDAPAGAWLKYIIQQRVTTKFTPNFVTALSLRLAAYLSGPITKDLKQKTQLFNASELSWRDAAALDAIGQQNNAYKNATPAHIAARSS